MAKLSLPTSRDIAAPLLIEKEQLERLDEIIDKHLPALREYKDSLVQEMTEKDALRFASRRNLSPEQSQKKKEEYKRLVLARFRNDARSATIYITRGRDISAERFSEVLGHPGNDEETPLGLSYFLRIGEVTARVRLSSSSFTREISIEVEPNNVEVALQLFGSLSNWSSDIEAPRWQQKWCEYSWIPRFLLAMFLLIGVIFVPLSNRAEAGRNANKAEAQKLLSQGINQNNQQRALELLLAISSDYNPNPPILPLGLRYWGCVVFGALILVGASVCPKVSIGVWRGKKSLTRARSWLNAVTYGIPGLAFTSVVWPWILHLLGISP